MTMPRSRRPASSSLLLAVLFSTMLLGAGCAAESEGDDTTRNEVEAKVATEADAEVPLYSEDDEVLDSEDDVVLEKGIEFDDCCVSLAGVQDCRGKPNANVCTQFRKVSGSTSFYCSPKKKKVKCPKWQSYSCYKSRAAKVSSIPCCSGQAAYSGSALYCK